MYKPDGELECLSNNIRLFCKNNNLSNTDMCTLLGVSRATYDKWLCLKSMPNAKAQESLARLFRADFKKICSSTVTARLMIDTSLTIEDVYPYNCIIAASFGFGNGGPNAMIRYEESDREMCMKYKHITPFEFDKLFTEKLNYREQMVIQLRYRDGLSLDECGKKMGVTRERIRQIENKALRIINYNLDNLIKKRDALEKVMVENERLKKCIIELEAAKNTTPASSDPDVSTILDHPIEDFDLSIRAYNCLKRYKIDTIRDIVTRNESFFHIRNLGRKAMEEIINLINSLELPYEFDHEVNYFKLES